MKFTKKCSIAEITPKPTNENFAFFVGLREVITEIKNSQGS